MQPASPSIGNLDYFNNWTEVYYTNPQPEQVPQFIAICLKEDWLNECNIQKIRPTSLESPEERKKYNPSIFTLSQLFRKHSEKVWDWMKELKNLQEKPLRGLIDAVWMSNTEQGRKVLERFRDSPYKISTYAEEVLQRPVIDIDSLQPIYPAHFDWLWAAFSITGNLNYIGKLIDSIPIIKQQNHIPLQERHVYVLSITWSIEAHISKHPQIIKYVIEYCQNHPQRTTDPNIQALLNTMLSHMPKTPLHPAAA